ncbi:MAG TPA: protoporphyrinogen oxidase [Candidatus Eisenbacteria bacterium]|nr:protoporphyrinogen oxidase [Candidatus Eisenbacteria bacterium]
MRVVIIGGGIAGLSAAWAIRAEAARRAESLELTVLEAGSRAGGRIRSTREDGYLVEWAANAVQGTENAAWRLAESVGLADQRVLGRPDAARRYIWRGGRLHRLPLNPAAFFGFTGLSPAARLRVAMEPFFANRVKREESVHDYAVRHIGEEAASVLIGAVVRGVFAGNSKRLSVDAAFPVMREMERSHRSLVVAMIARSKKGGAGRAAGPGGRALWSFTRGLESLTDALAARLGNAVRIATPALALERTESGYVVRTASGDRLAADSVVLAISARAAAALLRPLDAELAKLLGTIEPAGVAVVGLAFRTDRFRTPPDGYGYLVVPGEDLPILGALFESNLFPGRAPEGQTMVRVIMGGADRPDLLTRSDADLAGLAMGALDKTHGLASGPERTWVIRQDASIPQYAVGHMALLADLDRRLAANPRLYLAGNGYRGVSVASLTEDAERIAARVVSAPGG